MSKAVIVAAVLVAVTATAARATPIEDLDHGRQLFQQRDWLAASKELDALLYPTLRLTDRDNTVEAHALFGACELELGDRQIAHDEFEKALLIDPEKSLPALSYSEAAIKLFEDVKVELRVRAERAADRERAAKQREDFENALKNNVFYEQHSVLQAYLPFGIGQFQNGQNTKGVILAVSESATFLTSTIIWYYLVNKFGLSGTVPNIDEARTVRREQEIEIGSGALFFGLALYGIIDARLHYQPDKKIDPTQLPPDVRDQLPGAPRPLPLPKPAKTSFHLGPILVPSGAGVGLAWER